MLAMKNIVIIILLGVLSGCIAGGISQYHDPTKNVLADGVYRISMELSAPGGNAKKAFTAAQIVVTDHQPRQMKRASANKEEVIFVVEIPIEELPVGAFSYYFVYQSDGKRHEFRPTHNLPVTVKNR